jgi:putative SOS response-associated peptidase YedK
MCGRYRRRSDKQRIAEAFEAGMGLEDVYLEPSDDVAPGSMQPVVYLHSSGERAIALMRWGFKTPDRLLFNTRSETATTANFWKDSFLKRRCLVPADSFYEWAKGTGREKVKFEFAVPGREPFGLAGVWSIWKNPKTGEREPTFSILTGEANGVMRPIHDRQPIIAEPRDYREWLVESERPPVHLLRLLPDEELRSTAAEPAQKPAQQQAELFDNSE